MKSKLLNRKKLNVMPSRIRYVKSASKTNYIPSNQKRQTLSTTSEKTILCLVIFLVVVLFVLPQWIEMFKSLSHR